MLKHFVAVSTLAACAGFASAQTVNGNTLGDGYGAARAVQTVETQFGDNQSEMNAAYARISGGRLYLALTGNIEANFNKLEIFIDSKAGGSNTYIAPVGQDGGQCASMNGFSFDTGFDPDYHLFVRRGNAGGNKFDLDYAILGTNSFSSYSSVFGAALTGSGTTGTGANGSPIEVAYDDSNTAGVLGGTNAADQTAALAVTTGLELSIALSDLGLPAGAFNVMVFQNGNGHNYASNQFLGGLAAPQGNLGGDGTGGFTGGLGIDMDNFAGNQYFSVPEPSTLSLLALGALAMIRRRG
ncbi:MAG: PEP-CTERM sorting domain-containing protein [Phycisphaerae bacterium]